MPLDSQKQSDPINFSEGGIENQNNKELVNLQYHFKKQANKMVSAPVFLNLGSKKLKL
jgi:hypothetical protein